MPAGKGGYAVTITAIDDASKRIDAINKKLDSISAPVRRLQKSFGNLAESTGLRAFNDSLKGIHQRVAGIAATVSRFAGPLAALSGGLGAAGIVDATKRWGDFGSSLLLASRRAGMSTTQLQILANTSRLAKGTAEGAIGSAQELQHNLVMGTAGAPGTGNFRAAMSRLGVNDWQGKNASQVMPEVLKKLAAIHNVQVQKYFGEAIFGGSFDQMQPMLEQGVRGWRQWTKEVQQAGVATQKEIQDAYDLAQQQQILEMSIEKTGYTIMGALTPNIIAAEKGITAWVQANRQWLAADISGTVTTVATDIKSVSTALGGLKNVSSAFIEWWLAKFAPPFMRPFIRADAAIQAISDYAKAHHLPGATEGEHTARGAVIGAGVGSVVPGVGTGLGAALGAGVGATWFLDPFGLNDITPGQAARGAWHWMGFGGGKSGPLTNNNPLNLKYLPSQLGTTGQRNGFGVYKTPAYGYAAATNQLLMYGQHGDDTIRQIVSKWAPPGDGNPTDQYIRNVAGWTGYGPDQHLNLYDPVVMGKLVSAMEQQEQGRAANPSDVKYGVDMGFAERRLGAGGMAPPAQLSQGASAPEPVTHTVKGNATISVRLSGAPAGTVATASTDGDLFSGPPRIEMPMPAGGGPN